MKQLITLISALFFLTIGVSQVWALPACPSSGYFDNCYGTYTYGPETEWAGDKYVGEWKDDKFHGQGTYTYANGDKYVGEYQDNKRTGQGTYTSANGSKKVAEWENDNLNGYAITYKSDGSVDQEGIFKDDVFQYAQKKSKLDKHKDFCKEIGFTPKTESFGNCVLKLMDKD